MLPVVNSANGRLRGGLSDYFKRRARRILPPYYVALALSLFTLSILPQSGAMIADAAGIRSAANFSWGNVLSHLFLVHNLFPQWQPSINIAMWSIGTEWQIYFVFPFLLLPIWRRYGNKAVLAAGSLVPHATVINVGCPWYIGLFTMGMVGAVLSFRTSARTKAWQPYLPAITAGLCVIYVMCKLTIPEPFNPMTGHDYHLQWIKDYVSGLAAMCLLIYCTGLVREPSPSDKSTRGPLLLRVLQTPKLVFVGTFSYSLYLVHGIILNIINALFAVVDIPTTIKFLVRLFAGIPLSMLCAYLFFLLVERRFLSAPTAARVQAEQKSPRSYQSGVQG